MEIDIFLKIGDVEGESTDSAHGGEIEVDGWNWGASNGEPIGGGGGGIGKPDVQDITIGKLVDKSSARLMLASLNGQHFNEALLVIVATRSDSYRS